MMILVFLLLFFPPPPLTLTDRIEAWLRGPRPILFFGGKNSSWRMEDQISRGRKVTTTAAASAAGSNLMAFNQLFSNFLSLLQNLICEGGFLSSA